MDDGLRNLRPDSAQNALRAHQSSRGNRFQQVLRDQRIYSRHAGNIDNCKPRVGVHDRLQKRLHDHLGAGAVQRADQRKGNNPIPQGDHRSGKLEHLLLLPVNNLIASVDEGVRGMQRELVEKSVGRRNARK